MKHPSDSTAAYIQQMTSELSGMALSAGLDTLAYLLSLAKEEATAPQRGIRVPLDKDIPIRVRL